jgi:NagD protein
MSDRRDIECWLTDMDGVLVHENHPIPGAAELLQQWQDQGAPYLVLTNNSIFTPRDLSARLRASGLHVPEERIWTSALATADFLASQIPGGTAFVIGEAGITTALHEAGFIMTETKPDYVVIGETRNYSFEAITKAIRLIGDGARFIATNPDATGPSADGPMPATGAVAALISKATGKEPYVVGKPNPMMFRSALNKIGAHSENTAMIGDRMDTDIVAGIEAGLHTILVLTGISDESEINRYPFRPDEILSSVAELVLATPAETELEGSLLGIEAIGSVAATGALATEVSSESPEARLTKQ